MASCEGFTLIELLVVIAILGLLSALLLPAIAGARKKTHQVVCISNFKQMGAALLMYATDNSEWLPPGPYNPGASTLYGLDLVQSPGYNSGFECRKSLPYYLTAGFSLPAPSTIPPNTAYIAKVFICPAYAHSMPGNSGSGIYNPETNNYLTEYSYSALRSLKTPDYEIPFRPFGKESSEEPAHKLSEVQAAASSVSSVWALADIDAQVSKNDPVAAFTFKYSSMAKTPVHGKSRNFLFFDFHVAPKRADQRGPDQF